MYSSLYCYVQPAAGAVYKILFHVVDNNTYRFDFAGYQRRQTWWWTSQIAANSLVQNGIQTGTQHTAVTSSTCSSFGPSRLINGSVYHFLFYCTAQPASGYPEAVVLDVSDRTSADVRVVSYTQQLPVTPVDTTPTPSSNTTNDALSRYVSQLEFNNEMDQWQSYMNEMEWGTEDAPSAGAILLGAVGCADDPNDDHYYKSYGAC
jgi:hypothetical protein